MFLKISPKKIILTILLFTLTIVFFLPVKMNVLCSLNSKCPPVNALVKINELSSPRFLSINYLYLFLELLSSYILSCLLLSKFKKNKL